MGQQKQRNRRWVLASRPHGAPVPENFRLEEMMSPHWVKDRCYCAQFICPWTRICVDV
ncbi:putative zinc-binding dehydrogenase [Escherichia coli]|uniref:Putative zinc-binding dehydrogenase n=1 Tax=Escherichia coli TaxID=562 RepID=A0A376TH99_ECOLX|nr:putative zinc-binding dehydrogenase [Escherichia coli]